VPCSVNQSDDEGSSQMLRCYGNGNHMWYHTRADRFTFEEEQINASYMDGQHLCKFHSHVGLCIL
jgi:hypothetical protein